MYLDRLAVHRRSLGLPATSLAFRLSTLDAGVNGELTDGQLDGMARLGLPPLVASGDSELFDAVRPVMARSCWRPTSTRPPAGPERDLPALCAASARPGRQAATKQPTHRRRPLPTPVGYGAQGARAGTCWSWCAERLVAVRPDDEPDAIRPRQWFNELGSTRSPGRAATGWAGGS